MQPTAGSSGVYLTQDELIACLPAMKSFSSKGDGRTGRVEYRNYLHHLLMIGAIDDRVYLREYRAADGPDGLNAGSTDAELLAERDERDRRLQALKTRQNKKSPFPSHTEFYYDFERYSGVALDGLYWMARDTAVRYAYMSLAVDALQSGLVDEKNLQEVVDDPQLLDEILCKHTTGQAHRLTCRAFVKTMRRFAHGLSPSQVKAMHEKRVWLSLVSGETVPEEVLADYPGLTDRIQAQSRAANLKLIERVIQNGQNVPMEILLQYPELVAKYGI